MTKLRSTKRNDQRKLRVRVMFTIAAIVVLAAAALWVLSQLKPSWLPAWPWLGTASLILAVLSVAIPLLGSLFSDILLPLIDRSEAPSSPGVKELRDQSPLLATSYDSLIKGLGNGGSIPWIERGMASLSLWNQHDRVAIIGPMKSGKTREALELIRIAELNGLISVVFRPAGAISVIDPGHLASAVAVQLDQPCLFFIDDIGANQDEAYLDRLSICIDTIAHNRPEARFVITLQVERLQLSEPLQAWVEKHRFHRLSPPDLTAEQRHELAEAGTKALKASLTPEAVAVLGNHVEIRRPWDIVWVLQSALDRKTSELPLTEHDVGVLLAEGEQAVWTRQRQALIKIEPAVEHLLKSIGVFFSAGATPRQSSILRYAACLMPDAMNPSQKRLHLRRAANHLQQYAIVATEGFYVIPEPRLLSLITELDRARKQLHDFLTSYNPGFWPSLAFHLLRPYDLALSFLPSVRPRSVLGRKVGAWVDGLITRLASFPPLESIGKLVSMLLEPVYAWPGDRALLAAELGSPGPMPSYLSSNVIMGRALAAFHSGAFRAALDQCSVAIALNPTNTYAFALRGVAYRQMEQYERALADLNQAIELDPTDAGTILRRGEIYQEMGQYERALTDLNRAAVLDPKDVSVIVRRGVTYRLMNEHAKALADLNQAVVLDPKNASIIVQRGILYGLMGDHARSLADFDQAMVLVPNDVEALANRGVTYRLMGQYEQALVDLDQAVVLDPKNASIIVHRGVTYWLMGKYELALVDFNRAIGLDEKNAWAIAYRGEMCRLIGKYELALADFDRAIGLDEKNDWAITRRGETYRLMGKYELALADFDRAIALDEKNVDTISHRGETHKQMGQYLLALADFDHAIGLDEKNAWAITRRGETYRLMGQYEAALADFDRAIALDVENAGAIARRGEIYQLMGRYELALADFDRAIGLDEKYVWAMTYRGETYRRAGKYELALADFNRAIELDVKSPWDNSLSWRDLPADGQVRVGAGGLRPRHWT